MKNNLFIKILYVVIELSLTAYCCYNLVAGGNVNPFIMVLWLVFLLLPNIMKGLKK